MDAVLERRALVHEVQAVASPLALGPHLRIGKPDLRHEVTTGKLGQDPGVDPIGLAGERGKPSRCASAIRTSQPANSSWSWTKRAPVIDSIAARTGPCSRARRWTRCARPSRSGGQAPAAARSPSASTACQSRRLRLRSSPTYNIAGPPLLWIGRSVSGREALLHRIHYELGASKSRIPQSPCK